MATTVFANEDNPIPRICKCTDPESYVMTSTLAIFPKFIANRIFDRPRPDFTGFGCSVRRKIAMHF